MNSIASSTSTSLVEAINFLTRPLCPIIPFSTLNSLQQILLSSFIALPTWRRSARLNLTFTSSVPPRIIFDACIVTRVNWPDWYYALGGREFDLTIERTSVSLQAFGISGRIVIWKSAAVDSPTFLPPTTFFKPEPRSLASFNKPSQPTHLRTPTTWAPTHHQPRTLAQQLLQEHEMEEANEIFAMISNLNPSLISPTPNTEYLAAPSASVIPRLPTLAVLDEEIFHSQSALPQSAPILDSTLLSPLSSPESSRSNSPSTTLSPFSSQESLSIVSTMPQTFKPAMATAEATKFFPAASKCVPPCPRRETSQAAVQRYLYQGGQSTVLTGGVMLGSTSKALNRSTSSGTKSLVRLPPPRMRKSASQFGFRNRGAVM